MDNICYAAAASVGSECVKCGYGLCYMQQEFEPAADHFLTPAAKKTGSRNFLIATEKYIPLS